LMHNILPIRPAAQRSRHAGPRQSQGFTVAVEAQCASKLRRKDVGPPDGAAFGKTDL
jgi:hypothetical protein